MKLLNSRELVRRQTKTASSEASLPLPGLCIEALRLRRAEQDAWREEAAEAWDGDGLVVTTRFGRPVDPRNFHRKFKERAGLAGVREISVHDTRRTCASLLVALDVHPRVAMAILRHSQIAVTMNVYSEAPSQETQRALARLGAQFGEGAS
ncbi:site-specific integrase [Thalassiella azotivora]